VQRVKILVVIKNLRFSHFTWSDFANDLQDIPTVTTIEPLRRSMGFKLWRDNVAKKKILTHVGRKKLQVFRRLRSRLAYP